MVTRVNNCFRIRVSSFETREGRGKKKKRKRKETRIFVKRVVSFSLSLFHVIWTRFIIYPCGSVREHCVSLPVARADTFLYPGGRRRPTRRREKVVAEEGRAVAPGPKLSNEHAARERECPARRAETAPSARTPLLPLRSHPLLALHLAAPLSYPYPSIISQIFLAAKKRYSKEREEEDREMSRLLLPFIILLKLLETPYGRFYGLSSDGGWSLCGYNGEEEEEKFGPCV